MPNPKSTHGPCVHQGCPSQAKSFGRCLTHYWQLKRDQPEEIVRLKAMTTTERDHEFYKLNHPPLPKWQYENPDGEDYLARRQMYLDTHNVPLLTTWSELDDMMAKYEQENANGARCNESDEI